MTEVIYQDAVFDKHHKITFVPKKVRQLIIHKAGEDGQFLWFTFILEDGTKIETGYYQEI